MSKNGGGIFILKKAPPFFVGLRHCSGRIFGKSHFPPYQCPINVGIWVGGFRYLKIPHQKCSFLDFGRDRDVARGFAGFHFLENEQKWWGNFIYTKLPTFFGGLRALLRSDFREIVIFARSMPHKRWNLCGEILLFENTPPKMLIFGFRPGSERILRLSGLPFSGE
jgi:hypothetical protein